MTTLIPTRRRTTDPPLPCPCRLSATDHICRACGGQFDHVDLVRVAGGFVCRVPCQSIAVQRPEPKP